MRSRFSRFFVGYWWLILPAALSPLHYAHAYLDAGTGSYAIQVIIGAVFGGAYAVKSFGGRVVARFKKPQAEAKKPALPTRKIAKKGGSKKKLDGR